MLETKKNKGMHESRRTTSSTIKQMAGPASAKTSPRVPGKRFRSLLIGALHHRQLTTGRCYACRPKQKVSECTHQTHEAEP